MAESLIVDHHDALLLAKELATRQGTSIDDAVVEALRGNLATTVSRSTEPPQPVRVLSYDEMNAEQRARYDRLTALVEEFVPYRVTGVTSDHSDMYDDDGLPI